MKYTKQRLNGFNIHGYCVSTSVSATPGGNGLAGGGGPGCGLGEGGAGAGVRPGTLALTARAGNRRFRPLSALRAHTKCHYKMDFIGKR